MSFFILLCPVTARKLEPLKQAFLILSCVYLCFDHVHFRRLKIDDGKYNGNPGYIRYNEMNTNRSESVRIVSVPRDYLHQSFSIGKGRYGSVYKINHQELDQEDFLYAAKHCRFDVEGMFRHRLLSKFR